MTVPAQDQVSINVQTFIALWWRSSWTDPGSIAQQMSSNHTWAFLPNISERDCGSLSHILLKKQFSWAQESIKLIHGRKKISVRSIQQLLAEQIPKLGTNEEVLELRSCESFRGLLPHAYPIVMFFHGHSLLIAVFSVFSVVSHKAKTHQRKKQWTQHHPSVNLPPKNPTKKSITPRLFSFY